MTKEILDVVKRLLSQTFPFLRADSEIYVVPTLLTYGQLNEMEIQVYPAGSRYEDYQGGVVTEIFNLGIGLIVSKAINWSTRPTKILTSLESDILSYTHSIVTALENKFLENPETDANELTRPLRVRQITSPRTVSEDPLTLVVELQFTGGCLSARST